MACTIDKKKLIVERSPIIPNIICRHIKRMDNEDPEDILFN